MGADYTNICMNRYKSTKQKKNKLLKWSTLTDDK